MVRRRCQALRWQWGGVSQSSATARERLSVSNSGSFGQHLLGGDWDHTREDYRLLDLLVQDCGLLAPEEELNCELIHAPYEATPGKQSKLIKWLILDLHREEEFDKAVDQYGQGLFDSGSDWGGELGSEGFAGGGHAGVLQAVTLGSQALDTGKETRASRAEDAHAEAGQGLGGHGGVLVATGDHEHTVQLGGPLSRWFNRLGLAAGEGPCMPPTNGELEATLGYVRARADSGQAAPPLRVRLRLRAWTGLNYGHTRLSGLFQSGIKASAPRSSRSRVGRLPVVPVGLLQTGVVEKSTTKINSNGNMIVPEGLPLYKPCPLNVIFEYQCKHPFVIKLVIAYAICKVDVH